MKTSLLDICAALALLTAIAPASATVEVEINLKSPQALEVSYKLPEACTSLPFNSNLENHAQQIRGAWKSLDDCGSTDGKSVIKSKAACGAVRFEVPATTQFFDRVYPGSFPMGEGIYAHTSNYAVTDACGAVNYTFKAAGSIAFKGQVQPSQAHLSAPDAAYMPVLMLEKSLPTNSTSVVYVNPALGDENKSAILQMVDQSERFFHAALPDAHYRKPILAATLAQDGRDPDLWGDAADVLRLSLYNWPQHPDAALTQRLRGFITHEIAHRFQPGAGSGNTSELMDEGGAEFLRWYSQIRQQWTTQDDAAAFLNNAINQCVSTLGGQSWQNTPASITRGKAIYPCGLSIHVFGLATRQNAATAIGQMNHLYSASADGKRLDFMQTLECGDKADCKPVWLPRLLGKEESFNSVVSDFFTMTKLGKPVPPTAQQLSNLQAQAFANLMKEDCNGRVSFYPKENSFRIGAISGCTTLKEPMQIVSIEDLAVLTDASVLDAMRSACQNRGSVKLGLKVGLPISLSCKTPPALPIFYAVDIPQLLKNLGIAPR